MCHVTAAEAEALKARSLAAPPAVARRRTPREDCTMRTITRMFLVVLCAWCSARWQGAGAARRRDYEPYMFAAVPLHAPVPVLRVLSPAPLAVPSTSHLPTHRARLYSSSVQHTPYTRPYGEPRPYADRALYAESRPYSDVRPYTNQRPYNNQRPYTDQRSYTEPRSYTESRPYSNSRPYVETVEYYEPRPAAVSGKFAVDWERLTPPVLSASSLEEPLASQEAAVLYARPSGSGGYTYRRVSGKKPPKKVASSKDQPVVVKIHKHKIIKS